MTLALVLFAGLLVGGNWALTPDLPRAVLEAKYHDAADAYVDVAGITLHVRDSGPRHAPVLILLHGFGSSLQTFDGWVPALAREYRVVRYDLPGFALTGPDPTGDYSDARSLAVLTALMDRLGIQRATLIGNSMGGKIAWQFAAAHPERTQKLVLISPDGFASKGFAYGKSPKIPWVVRLLPYFLPKILVRLSLSPAYGDRARLTDAVVTRYSDLMRAPGVRAAMIARMEQIFMADPRPLLRTIRAPTLLLWGTRDGLIPISNAADYVKEISDCTLVELPGLGHVPFEEAPALSLAPVLTFLGG